MAETLSKESQVLLEKDAIKELVYEWDYPTDTRDEGMDVIERFCTEDVIHDGGSLGSAEGKEAFKELSETLFSEDVLFTRHMRHHPIIRVDGDEATGKWYAQIPSISGEGEAVGIQGTYEIGFRRVGGEWKISK